MPIQDRALERLCSIVISALTEQQDHSHLLLDEETDFTPGPPHNVKQIDHWLGHLGYQTPRWVNTLDMISSSY